MIVRISTRRNASTVVHAPVALSISLYLSMGSAGRSLRWPRFELRVEVRNAISKAFSWLVQWVLVQWWSRVNLCCNCLAAPGRSSDRVLYTISTASIYKSLVRCSRERSRLKFGSNATNLPPALRAAPTLLYKPRYHQHTTPS